MKATRVDLDSELRNELLQEAIEAIVQGCFNIGGASNKIGRGKVHDFICKILEIKVNNKIASVIRDCLTRYGAQPTTSDGYQVYRKLLYRSENMIAIDHVLRPEEAQTLP